MSIDLVFDTETTGKADFKAPAGAEQQPDLVQLGMQVYVDGYPVLEYAPLVATHSPIHPEAMRVHGITEEMRKTYGLDPHEVAKTFCYWLEKADRVVAHNLQFDAMIVQTFLLRYASFDDPAKLFARGKVCTMKSATPVCKIKGPYGHKWPKLIEAYCILVDEKGFEGAHNALVDVNACAKILWALEKQQHKLVA